MLRNIHKLEINTQPYTIMRIMRNAVAAFSLLNYLEGKLNFQGYFYWHIFYSIKLVQKQRKKGV